MSARIRNKVHLAGVGTAAMVFAHGFGCDQTVWRFRPHMSAPSESARAFDAFLAQTLR